MIFACALVWITAGNDENDVVEFQKCELAVDCYIKDSNLPIDRVVSRVVPRNLSQSNIGHMGQHGTCSETILKVKLIAILSSTFIW